MTFHDIVWHHQCWCGPLLCNILWWGQGLEGVYFEGGQWHRSKLARIAHLNPNFPNPTQLFRMPRLWKAVENLTDGLWPAQVDRISRTCRKQESIVRNFRIYFCASETAKFGGWLKIFTVNYPTKVKCCRSSSTGHAIAQGQKGAPNILWIYCMTIVVITMARDKYD